MEGFSYRGEKMKCANLRIISDLPMSGNTRIDNKAMVGYSLSVMIGNEIKQVEVKDYIIDKGRRKFVLGCNGYCDKIIHCFSIFEPDNRFKYLNLRQK